MRPFQIKLVLLHIILMICLVLLVPFIQRHVRHLGFSILIAGFILGGIVLLAMQRMFVDPIQQMVEATRRIKEGDFSQKVHIFTNDELADLADNLNEMAQELQHRIQEVTREKKELTMILSEMREGVIVIDGQERVLLMSDPVYAMLELRCKNAVGRRYWEVIRNDNVNQAVGMAIADKKGVRCEFSTIGDQERHFNLQISPVIEDNENLAGLVVLFHDITEFKRLAKMRSEFVANVSHELKTPLTSIKGFAETLKESKFEDKEASVHFLNIIHRQAIRLENLVNDILSLSKIESNGIAMTLEDVDLRQVAENMGQLFAVLFKDKDIRFGIDVRESVPPVKADRGMVEQVLSNLLENAVKFTPEGGSITVQITHENAFVRLAVSDTGIGIAKEHLPRLFERFYRVDKARSRELGGTGLGLAIVKHIIQAHGGQVKVDSRPGHGTTFSVLLPRSS